MITQQKQHSFLLFNFFKKALEKAPTPAVKSQTFTPGEYVIAKIIDSIKHDLVFCITMPFETRPLKGVIEDFREDNLKINGEWYHIGSTVGDIQIVSVINKLLLKITTNETTINHT